MGKIADAIRGTALPEQNRMKLLSLDQEFANMEAEIQTLKSENQLLQAKVNPLEREVERLKNETEKNAAHGHSEAGGALFKRLPGRGYSDIPYCPKCHSAMFHFAGPFPFQCGNQACKQEAGFSKSDLARVMSTLPK